MPEVGGTQDALHQYPAGVVLTGLELVAHYGHLAIEVLFGDKGVDHAVGLHVQGPVEVLVTGTEGFEVVSAVVPGGAIGPGTVLGQLLGNIGVIGRTLEDEVLE